MAIKLKATRKYPSLPYVSDDPKNHTQVLTAIREALETGQRRTNDVLNSFVRVQDLIDIGLITIEGNTKAIVGSDLSEIANIADLSTAAAGEFLRFDGTDWFNDTLHLADITSAMVTQHQGDLVLTESQITNLVADLAAKQPLDATLTALAAFNTNGLLTQTAADTFTGRTITGTSNRLSVSNGNGVAGNPTLDIDTAYVGQTSITTLGTITTGVWNGTDLLYAAIQDVSATSRVLGRISAGSGVIEELTAVNIGTIITAITQTWSGNHTWTDNSEVRLGTGADLRIFHDGTNNFLRSDNGDIIISFSGTERARFSSDASTYIRMTPTDAAGPSGLSSGATGIYCNALFQLPRVAAASNLRQSRINGSFASPTTLVSGDIIAQNSFLSFNGTSVDTGAAFVVSALETWNAAAQGTAIKFQTCAVGAAALTTRLQIASGVYDNAMTDKGVGTLNFSTFYEGGAELRIKRNNLKNGSFTVAQAGATIASVADGVIGLDEWYVLTQSNPIQVDQATAPFDGARFNLKGTQTNASSQRFGFEQLLLGRACKHLRGQTVQVSMRVKTSAAANVRLFLIEWTGTEDAAPVDIVNTWTSTTFTLNNFFINNASLSTINGPTSTGTTTPATWTDMTLTATLGSTFNNLYIFVYIAGAQAQNATFEVANANFSPGSVAPVSPYTTAEPETIDHLRVWTKPTGLSILQDNAEVQLGLGTDLRLYHDGTNSYCRSDTGAMRLSVSGTTRLAATTTGVDVTGITTSTDEVKVTTAGKGVSIKEGTNARMGTAVLVGGTVVVNTTAVTANSRIILTIQVLGTVATPKSIGVTARTAGTSFTITSADVTDTSTVAWVIMEPA